MGYSDYGLNYQPQINVNAVFVLKQGANMGKDVILKEPWSFAKAVARCKPMVETYKKIELDLLKELFSAREALANQGFRSDLTSGQMSQGSPNTWESFCDQIGILKRTANRWLFLYDHQNDCLLEPEEARSRRDQMLEQMFRQIQAHSKKDPSWRPEDWTAPFERAYQKWLGELKTLNAIEQKGFEQAEMFSREYLRVLAQQMQEDPSPEEMLYQEELCIKYENVVTPLVRVEQQISIARIVEKSILMFPLEARSAVARSVAKIVMDMSDHMEGEK